MKRITALIVLLILAVVSSACGPSSGSIKEPSQPETTSWQLPAPIAFVQNNQLALWDSQNVNKLKPKNTELGGSSQYQRPSGYLAEQVHGQKSSVVIWQTGNYLLPVSNGRQISGAETYWPATGPDGQWAVVERVQIDKETTREYLVYSDGLVQKTIFEAQYIASPSFSEDGLLAFAAGDEKLRLHLYMPTSDKTVSLNITNLDREHQIMPSFGQNHVLYFSSGNRTWDIYKVDLPKERLDQPLTAAQVTTLGDATYPSFYQGILLFQRCSTFEFDKSNEKPGPVCKNNATIWAQNVLTLVTWQVTQGKQPSWYLIHQMDFPELVAVPATPTATQ